jgi:hypothetical protein
MPPQFNHEEVHQNEAYHPISRGTSRIRETKQHGRYGLMTLPAHAFSFKI